MTAKFEKTVLILQKLLITKYLANDATKYINILSSENASYEDKHFANILAEDLISKVRDFPEINIATVKKK